MRIASDFHDYYDIGQSLGQDQTLVYQRYAQPVVLDRALSNWWNYGNDHPIWIQSYTVGFCGKLYPVLELNNPKNKGLKTKEARDARRICFSLQDVERYIQKNFKPKDFQDWHEKYPKNTIWNWHYRRFEFERFFENSEGGWTPKSDGYYGKFFENQSPVFVISTYSIPRNEKGVSTESKIVYNAPLKPLEFYRLFDPFQAYQEIGMWLSNQAVPIKPIPEISDLVMLEIKGFNKYSFRKPKTSVKRRK